MDSHVGFPCSPSGKNNLPTKAGDIRDLGSIPGLGRYHGGGNGNQLQCSCLAKPMDRSLAGCKELDMTEQLTLLLLE